ncbi:hypothetical protein L1049_002023 [Liquidambar formosana]|uniref:Uncharacterized protein n=1 Tax=Liquidambar formosana TaxID=63359 RepID=A0AAP0NET6_LIQFO
MFFIGEFFGDIFTIIQKMLKKPITRESVAVAGECLRILVLLQTLSKASECQRGLMNLLLEAIVMVFSVSEDDFSQEVNDIRSTAIRLVSHLAQIPSSAVYFKDALLAMPVTHRQQLQGIIRASVTQDQSATQTKSTTPSLVIKLPVQVEGSQEKNSPTSSTTHSNMNSMEEEEDDWDAFQSFPASTAATNSNIQNAAEPPPLTEDPSDLNDENDHFQGYTSSPPLDKVKEIINAEHLEAIEEHVLSESIGGTDEIKKLNDFQSSNCDIEPCDNCHQESEDGAVPSQENDYRGSSDPQPVEDAVGSIKVNLPGEQQQRKEIQGDTDDLQAPSDPLPLKKISDLEHHGEAEDKIHAEVDEEAGKELTAESESNHHHKESGDSSGSLERQDDSAKLESLSEPDRT